MINAVRNKIKRMQKIDLSSMLSDVIKENIVQAQIIDLNQRQLYEQGVEADGNPTGDYSNATIRIKEANGDARSTPGETGHITLLDTGDFYDSMKVESTEGGFKITGDMIKPDNDLEVHWPKALGLTDENKEEALAIIRPELFEKIKEAL